MQKKYILVSRLTVAFFPSWNENVDLLMLTYSCAMPFSITRVLLLQEYHYTIEKGFIKSIPSTLVLG